MNKKDVTLQSWPQIVESLRAGDRVTILIPNGIGRNGQEWKEKTGRAVMRGPAGWVLNMGGRFGTPGVVTESNFVKASRPGGKI